MIGALVGATVTGSGAATKPERGYITNQLYLPSDADEATDFARDVDGDGTKDNQLGNVLAALLQASGSSGFDPTLPTSEAIESGDIVMLHSLRTFSLNNSNNATWQVWYGAPTVAPPDFTGGGIFELPTNQAHSGKLDAKIVNHVVKTVTGRIPLKLDFGGGPFTVKTVKSKIVAQCFKSGCPSGTLNGAITTDEIAQKFTPEFAEAMTVYLVADCTVPIETVECEPNTSGEAVNELFNLNEDLAISVVELGESSLYQTLLRPDLDIFKANGDPGHDGVDDAMSFGIGFTAVKATLTRP